MTQRASDPVGPDSRELDPVEAGGSSVPADLASGLADLPNAAAPDSGSADPDDAPGPPPAAPSLSDTAAPGSVTGWIPPAGADGSSRRRRFLNGCLILGAVVVAGGLLATAVLDGLGSGGPDIEAVGFGTGGSGCTLTDVASTFPLGVPIRDVVTFSPALGAGGTVTIRVELNGTEQVEFRDTVSIDEPAPCIYGTMSPREVGHYRVVYEVSPSTMPPISGEFDVTR